MEHGAIVNFIFTGVLLPACDYRVSRFEGMDEQN